LSLTFFFWQSFIGVVTPPQGQVSIKLTSVIKSLGRGQMVNSLVNFFLFDLYGVINISDSDYNNIIHVINNAKNIIKKIFIEYMAKYFFFNNIRVK
jgi:hypothetical protein